ncbi:MAG: hypothetical protein GX334_05520 [Firmicutes bacterium]|nr:hypothetical protein [Bacillota bacterium]
MFLPCVKGTVIKAVMKKESCPVKESENEICIPEPAGVTNATELFLLRSLRGEICHSLVWPSQCSQNHPSYNKGTLYGKIFKSVLKGNSVFYVENFHGGDFHHIFY